MHAYASEANDTYAHAKDAHDVHIKDVHDAHAIFQNWKTLKTINFLKNKRFEIF